jgi:hypothetical protein
MYRSEVKPGTTDYATATIAHWRPQADFAALVELAGGAPPGAEQG